MAKIGEQRQFHRDSKRIYSESELTAFDRELDKYRTTVKISFPEEREVVRVDWMAFYKSVGVMSADGAVILKGIVEETPHKDDGRPVIAKAHIGFLEIENKIEQFLIWKGRKEFGEKKRLEGLDKLANSYAVPATEEVEI